MSNAGLPIMIPKWMFFTTGFGTDREHINARDHASAPAGLAELTLRSGTSALPPGIKVIDRAKFNGNVSSGQEVLAIHGCCESDVPGQLVNATLCAAVPTDGNGKGFVAELYKWPGIHPVIAIRRTQRMVIKMYAERNGIVGFDPYDVWEPDRDTYELAGREVRIHTIQAEGIVPESGEWACALAALVLL